MASKLRLPAATLLVASLLPSTAGCRPRPANDARLKLVGGDEDAADQFPATVFLGNCSGTKIADYAFLTAAHCVVAQAEGMLHARYRVGGRITLSNAIRPDEASDAKITVSRTGVHPAYAALAEKNKGQAHSFSVYSDVPDVAIVVVREETPAIPRATIDEKPLGLDAIVLSGYGCEVVPPDLDINGKPRDPQADTITSAQAPDTTEFYAGARRKFGRARITALTPTKMVSKDQTNILGDITLKVCPGDSGGPVYRDDLDEASLTKAQKGRSVIGVNSYGTIGSSGATRLDSAGSFPVVKCIQKFLAAPAADEPTGIPRLCS